MSRNFGIMSSRPASSGAQRLQAGSHHSAGARADSNSFRSGLPDSRGFGCELFIPGGSILIPADPPFERGQFAQALIDILAVAFGIFFVCAAACSLPLAIFMLIVCSF